MMSLVAVLLVATFVGVALPAKLPSYIKACKRSDPKLNECAVKNGREAIPILVNGDAKLGIPKLDPLEIERLVVGDDKKGSGLGIDLICNKCKITGLRGVHLQEAKIDLKGRHFEVKASIPTLTVMGKYKAEGKVLILPINGEGDIHIVLGDLKLTYKFDFDLHKGKGNKEYIQLKNPKLDFKAEKFHIELTNLFKGDKTLGKQMNSFLNENWREVLKEFSPAIGETVSRVVFMIVNNIAQKVPYDEVLPK